MSGTVIRDSAPTIVAAGQQLNWKGLLVRQHRAAPIQKLYSSHAAAHPYQEKRQKSAAGLGENQKNPLENKSKPNHLTLFGVYQRLQGTVRHSPTLPIGPCAAARHDFGLAMRKAMHYHIRWSDSKLDWKPFSTREEAEQAARRLARRGETFTVEYADDKTCMQRICERMQQALQMANS